MAIERFVVYNTIYNESIANIEMDSDLLRPEAGIVDDESLTLKPIKGGGAYTLLPIEDHTAQAIRRVYDIYQSIKEKPCQSLSVMVSRTDHLIEAVGLLFGEVTYTAIESAADIANLINPSKDYVAKKIKHSILGDLFDKVLAEASLKTTNDK